MNHVHGESLTFEPTDYKLTTAGKVAGHKVVSDSSVYRRACDRKDVGPIFDIIAVQRHFCCNLNGLCNDPLSWSQRSDF